MDYYDLQVELASVECDKALLLVESAMELDECNVYTEGKKEPAIEEHGGLISNMITKIQKLFSSIRDWFRTHFTKKPPKGTKLRMSKKDMAKHKKLKAASEKAKNGARNKKKWVTLLAIIGSAGILGGAAALMHGRGKGGSSETTQKMTVVPARISANAEALGLPMKEIDSVDETPKPRKHRGRQNTAQTPGVIITPPPADTVEVDAEKFLLETKQINENFEAAAKLIGIEMKNGETPDEVAKHGNALLQDIAKDTKVNFAQMQEAARVIEPVNDKVPNLIQPKRMSNLQKQALASSVEFGSVTQHMNQQQQRAFERAAKNHSATKKKKYKKK